MSKSIFYLLLLIGLGAVAHAAGREQDNLNKCIFSVPKGIYDLSPLDQKDYAIAGGEGNSTLLLSLCSGLRDPDCRGASLCLKQGQNSSKITENLATPSWYLSNSMRLSYLGDICPQDNTTQQSLEVELRCSQKEGEPVLKDHKNCMYSIQWESKSACAKDDEGSHKIPGNQTDCTIVDKSGTKYDLSPLRNPHRNYYAINQAWEDISAFVINVCGPLVHEDIPCDGLKTGACRYGLQYHAQTLESLGSLTPVKTDIPSTLTFSNGPVCTSNNTMNRGYSVEFICSPSSGRGVPIVMPFKPRTCTHKFIWYTSYVCPKDVMDSFKESINKKESCVYKDPFTHEKFDLTALNQASDSPYQIPSAKYKGQTYNINICGAVSNDPKSRCSNSGFCRTGGEEEVNYGSYKEIGFSSKDRILTATYSHGDRCNNGSMEANIKFICDRNAGFGHPVFKEEKECHVDLEWRTIHVCATPKPQCNFISRGKYYNFTELSIAHEDWKVNDINGNELWVNLCGEMSHEHGCDRDTVVCMKDKVTNKIHSLGKFSDQFIRQHWTYGLQIVYGHGDSYCPGSSKMSSVEITFRCSEKTESVQYVSQGSLESDCITKLSWETPLACGQKLMDLPEAKDLIYDSTKKKAYDISSLADTVQVIPGNPGTEYIINLKKDIKKVGCEGASVCMLNGSQAYNIGEWNTRKFFKKSAKALITMSMSSNVPCHEDKKEKPMTYITLVCEENTEKNKVTLKYEDKNCETFFEWSTVNVCDNMARNMTSEEWAKISQVSGSSGKFTILVVAILTLLVLGLAIMVLTHSSRARNFISRRSSPPYTVFDDVEMRGPTRQTMF